MFQAFETRMFHYSGQYALLRQAHARGVVQDGTREDAPARKDKSRGRNSLRRIFAQDATIELSFGGPRPTPFWFGHRYHLKPEPVAEIRPRPKIEAPVPTLNQRKALTLAATLRAAPVWRKRKPAFVPFFGFFRTIIPTPFD